MKEYIIEPGQNLTDAQINEIEEACKHPIEFEDDCPELSPALIKAFRCITVRRKRNNGD